MSLLTQFSALTGGFRFSFEDGARMAETTFYRQGQWPQGFLTPAQVMWRPLPASSGSESSEFEPIRQLWIRFHPSTHASVFSTLRGAIPHALSQPAFQCQDVKVELNDVRESVCVFELTGPKSGKVLKGALGELVRDEPREEIKTVRPRPARQRQGGPLTPCSSSRSGRSCPISPAPAACRAAWSWASEPMTLGCSACSCPCSQSPNAR